MFNLFRRSPVPAKKEEKTLTLGVLKTLGENAALVREAISVYEFHPDNLVALNNLILLCPKNETELKTLLNKKYEGKPEFVVVINTNQEIVSSTRKETELKTDGERITLLPQEIRHIVLRFKTDIRQLEAKKESYIKKFADNIGFEIEYFLLNQSVTKTMANIDYRAEAAKMDAAIIALLDNSIYDSRKEFEALGMKLPPPPTLMRELETLGFLSPPPSSTYQKR